MKYIVIRDFLDLERRSNENSSGVLFVVGDEFPIENISKERIHELESGQNIAGAKFIQLVAEELIEEPKKDKKRTSKKAGAKEDGSSA